MIFRAPPARWAAACSRRQANSSATPRRRLRDLYNQAAGQAQQQVARLSDVIKDQPIASALVAIGIGYLLGRFTT